MTGLSRKDMVFRHVDKQGLGLEIGPSHSPFAPKKNGYRVHILDHMSREQLTEKYRDHSVELANIEEVDFVWHGERFVELTGRPKHYDWIIASHLIEHTPDLVGFLTECDSILNDDGVVSLVVPDKRYCFDHYRPISSLAQVIDSHVAKNTRHTPGTVAAYCLDVVSRSGCLGWNAGDDGPLKLIHTLDDARKYMHTALTSDEYLDVHAWCFVPHSFRLLIHDLYCLGLIPFREVEFFPGEGFEFFITLGRKSKGFAQSRQEMLEIIKAELAAGVAVSDPAANAVSTPVAVRARMHAVNLARRVKRALLRRFARR